jgi:alpha-1,3-glucosyltransferase
MRVNFSAIQGKALIVVLCGVMLRLLVGYFPYSGEKDPPRFGDYEAQRNWKELTVNNPLQEWYITSSEWWPLDYPPLTAYHEYIMGRISQWYEPDSVRLNDSRGYESNSHRVFMRMSVLISDLFSYFPAALMVSQGIREVRSRIVVLVLLIINPAIIFVDHSHFQYNCVACGLVIMALWLIQSDRPYLAAVAYTMSFMFKQTLLYFAPIFFAFMLGQALKLGTWKNRIFRILGLGACVVGTVGLILVPLVSHCETGDCTKASLASVLSRVFPFNRGIFEDYVANLWIVLSPLLRLRGATASYLRLVRVSSTVITLIFSGIPGWTLLQSPDPQLLPLGLAAGSLAFYLFSVMVHEKAIVLPLTFILLSILTLSKQEGIRFLALRCIEASFLSMAPLMRIEKSILSGFAIFAIGWVCCRGLLLNTRPMKSGMMFINPLQVVSNLFAAAGLIFVLAFERPVRYPFLGELIISSGCFVTFASTWFALCARLESSLPLKQKSRITDK